MLIQTATPIGLDWYIQQAQAKLHDALLAKWGLAASGYTSYDRIYRNKALDNGYIAETYTGDGKYKEVYYDDQVAATSFFGVSDMKTEGAVSKADVHLVFFVDLKELKSEATNRPDAEVRQEVYNVFGKCAYGLHFQSVETGLENVLKEYPGSRRDDRLKFIDMQPKHCFRINYHLFFNPNKQNFKF